MKTRIFALLCAVLLLLPLAGCASAPAVMRYGTKSVSANEYRYWLSTYKGNFLTSYSDMSDTDAFWDSVLYDDVTAEEYLNQAVAENVKRTLVCTALFDEYGLKLSDGAVADVDDYIADLIKERGNGSKNVLNQTLANFGINVDMLRDICLAESKTSQLFSYLYGKGGPREMSTEALDAYCAKNYVRICHIYVNNAYTYDMDGDNYKFDTTGQALTRALTDAEKSEKDQTVAAIETALDTGEDFLAVYETYSEDHYYKNGYYLTRTTDFIPEVVDAAFSLNVGEWTRVDSDYGVHFILRLEMDSAPYNNADNEDFFGSFASDAKNDDFRAYLDTLLPDVETDDEALSQYSIRDAAVNYSI